MEKIRLVHDQFETSNTDLDSFQSDENNFMSYKADQEYYNFELVDLRKYFTPLLMKVVDLQGQDS